MREALASVRRSDRRQLRLRCTLQVGEATLIGFSSNLSSTALSLRVDHGRLAGVDVISGLRVGLSFVLPGQQETLSISTEVAWVDPEDHQPTGEPALGIGLRFLQPAPHVTAALEAFLAEFRYTVMVVDHERNDLDQLERMVSEKYRVLAFASAAEAAEALEHEEVAVLVTDQRTSDWPGLELLRHQIEKHPYAHTVRVVIARQPRAEDLSELINVGRVAHYVQKPLQAEEVMQAVDQAVDRYALAVENARLSAELARANDRLQRENLFLRSRMTGTNGFEHILGNSSALREALSSLARVRLSEATVHIAGETGTGKELVARAIHFGGPRAKGPFVAQNCASITDTLLESTLFGHQRGAFTGADRARPGVFQEAHGGTLFLDEVGELSPAVQGALLRALQSGEIVAVGASRPSKVDVRVISATHKDLRVEVRAGRFREDLYFRLVVVGIRLPPLRERAGDVPLLARHFLDVYCERYGRNVPGFTYDAMQALERYRWPGNVRELVNEVERLIVLAEDGYKIPVELLSPHLVSAPSDPSQISGAPPSAAAFAELPYDAAVAAFERDLITRALESTGGVVARAARLLGMERTRLTKLRQRLGIV